MVTISCPCRHNEALIDNPCRHTLSNTEKKAYLDAELCLMKTPGTLGLRGARTKFDEFQSIHVYQSEIAHFVVSDAHPLEMAIES
jgi:tyrosinase